MCTIAYRSHEYLTKYWADSLVPTCICAVYNCVDCCRYIVESEASPSPVHRGSSSTRMFSCSAAVKTSTSDLGYSSGPETGCDSCSASTNSSTEGASSLIDCQERSAVSSQADTPLSLDHSCDGGVSCECGLSEVSYMSYIPSCAIISFSRKFMLLFVSHEFQLQLHFLLHKNVMFFF